MMNVSGFELYLRWFQLFVSLAFPIAISALLFVAWRDVHRWIDHLIERDNEEQQLAAEVREFIE